MKPIHEGTTLIKQSSSEAQLCGAAIGSRTEATTIIEVGMHLSTYVVTLPLKVFKFIQFYFSGK